MHSVTSLDIWKDNVKRLKRALKGWHLNKEDKYRKKKRAEYKKNNVLDIKSESTLLYAQESQEKYGVTKLSMQMR